MKWIEIIELRLSDAHREKTQSMLNKLINDAAREGNDLAVEVYRNADVSNGFSIHLTHDTKKVDNGGSQLGLSIAASLKAYGLVNHTIWLNMNGKK
jgi:hypothetical protein